MAQVKVSRGTLRQEYQLKSGNQEGSNDKLVEATAQQVQYFRMVTMCGLAQLWFTRFGYYYHRWTENTKFFDSTEVLKWQTLEVI